MSLYRKNSKRYFAMALNNSPNKRKVLVLFVGGEFGMTRTQDGTYAQTKNTLTEHLKQDRRLHNAEFGLNHFGTLKDNELVLPSLGLNNTIVQYEIKEYNPCLDSSNVRPEDWVRIASDVENHYKNFDGFVIIHGTDTLSYSASALSFMLEDLQKPVIFTGARMTAFEIRTDAKENFLHSVILAGSCQIPEVCIFFDSKLMRGNRTMHQSAESFNGFESHNYHNLVDVGMHIIVHDRYIRKGGDHFRVHKDMNTKVGVIYLSPTITAPMIEVMMKSDIEAAVIQSYGAGNFPLRDKDVQKVLRWAVERFILLVNITQCSQGAVVMKYETGKWLTEVGIANGRDMTCEAAVTKLCYVMTHKNLSYKEKFKMIETDLRGEMTINI